MDTFVRKNRLANMNPYILVVGSSNTDMVIKAEHLPQPGETIIGNSFFMNPGGKGANQAVAAARLGGNVVFICKTGNDIFGRQSVALFNEEGIDTSHLLADADQPSGVALITVDDKAENCIVVASGANATLSVNDLQKTRQLIERSSIVLMQLEIPLETVEYVARIAYQQGVKVILNPAPACSLADALLGNISILTPNKTEAEMLSGIQVSSAESAGQAARKIKDRGVDNVIITLGADGAIVLDSENQLKHVAGVKVTAIDTTAAGDVFNGALAVALFNESTLADAAAFACRAAAVSVTRMGAQASAPYKREVSEPIQNSI